jgi:ubiquinone/menaquinone biosynthesis C-methylase UbiE
MRTVHKKRQPTVDIRAGTAYELPVEDSSVDAIICAQVIFPVNVD